jgi:hypothetical protein
MIIDLLIFFIVSIFISFFIKFVDFCFYEGNIFDKYYLYIHEKFEEKSPKLFKVIGGCIFCYGTWIYIITFSIFNIYYPLPILFIILGMGINYISIHVLNNYID